MRSAQQRQGTTERSIEEMMSADAYGVYAEVRRVGTLAQADEIKTAVGALKQLGGEDAQSLTELFDFLDANGEQLAEARAVVFFMPTRAELPQALIAFELASPETAVAFEPKFRRFVGDQMKSLEGTQGPKQSTERAGGARRTTTTTTTRGASESPARPNASSNTSASSRTDSSGASEAPAVSFKRAGRWLFAADEPFTFKSLRGEEGSSSLSENVRFQTARSRFASDSLFVYVDTTQATAGYTLQQQKAQEERERAEANANENRNAQIAPVIRASPVAPTRTKTLSQADVTVATTPTPQTSPAPSPEPSNAATPQEQGYGMPQSTPVPSPTEEQTAPQTDEESSAGTSLTARQVEAMPAENGAKGVAITASKPSEEEEAAWRMGGVMRALWEGAPRIPGAVALGLGIEGGSLRLRLAVENTPDGVVSIIPFLPNIISGAPVTAEAASVAPDDSDIFFVGSLDWQQIYTNTLGTASLNPQLTRAMWEDGEGTETSGSGKQPAPEETIAAVEKLFGFKFKEDLLPSLGNEVAVSVPLNFFMGISRINRPKKDEKEKDSEPGAVAIVSLNDPEKIRAILPRVVAALGLVSAGAAFTPPEKREGFEIRGTPSFAYAIINNSLVISDDVRAVRHVVDSFAAHRTLADSASYRDSTDWQARQRLAHVFLSDALMRSTIESTKKTSGNSTDPFVRALLAQLEMPPAPASYQVTNEGDVLMHELRVPINLLKAYAISEVIMMKDMAVLNNEGMAVFSLNRITYAESNFKDEKKKGRYGTLEELVAEKLLEKELTQHTEYKLELNPSGDKFEATATPKAYGKTGRRSFFVDETGTVRAADHAGQPATADDPPID